MFDSLKESGLVQGEVDGPKVCYCINAEKLALLKALIASLRRIGIFNVDCRCSAIEDSD